MARHVEGDAWPAPKVLDGQDPFDADDIKPALLRPIPDYEIAILALYRARVSKRPLALHTQQLQRKIVQLQRSFCCDIFARHRFPLTKLQRVSLTCLPILPV